MLRSVLLSRISFLEDPRVPAHANSGCFGVTPCVPVCLRRQSVLVTRGATDWLGFYFCLCGSCPGLKVFYLFLFILECFQKGLDFGFAFYKEGRQSVFCQNHPRKSPIRVPAVKMSEVSNTDRFIDIMCPCQGFSGERNHHFCHRIFLKDKHLK